MSAELTDVPEYRSALDRLEALKKTTTDGAEYWMARDINHVLGYCVWLKFEPVIERARQAFRSNGIEPSHHIARTAQMMEVGGEESARG